MELAAIDVKCPACGEKAQFEEPFEFIPLRKLPTDEKRPFHHWGGWAVIERFPSLISWKAPTGSQQYLKTGGDGGGEGYTLQTNGLIQCLQCYLNRKHKLSWPDDAFWQWEVRGQILWAWNRTHAIDILSYIRQNVRPSRRLYQMYHLRYIPSHFLAAKVRELVVQKMEAALL